MEVLRGNITRRFKSLVLSSLFFFPIKVSGSEQSHATFKVEKVGPVEQSGDQLTSYLPAMNEINNMYLVLLGMLLLLLGIVFMKFKKGDLYEK